MTNTLEHRSELKPPGRGIGGVIASGLGGIGRRELGMLAALIVLCIGLWASNGDFLGQSNVINTTRQISMLGIFAIGSAFVIITGGIDLSVGSLVGLTGVLIAKFSSPADGAFHYPIWVGITLAMLIVLAIGLIQGLLITRLDLQPFIVTLGGMLLIRGISQTIVQGGTIGFGDLPFQDFANNGLFTWRGDPLISYPMLVFLIVIVVGAYLLHFTVFGRYVYAIGGNRDAAAYSGIPVKRVETLTYVISAGLAGVAGICYASYIGQMSQNVGIAYELYAIAACVLGGCSLRGGEGTVIGVVIGSALMRVIDNGIIMFRVTFNHKIRRLDTNWNMIIIGGVILVAVILDQIVHLIQEKRRTRAAGAMAQAAVAPPAPEHPQSNVGTMTPP
jgi:ribose transport system permease protein